MIPPGPLPCTHVEIHIELARERANSREHLQAAPGAGRRSSCRGVMFAAAESRRRLCRCRFGPSANSTSAASDLDQIALGAEHVRDASAPRRRYLNDRLVGLDRNQRLIGDDVIAFIDMPGDDLRLFETFAEIRQHELAHEDIPPDSANCADLAGSGDDARDRRHDNIAQGAASG